MVIGHHCLDGSCGTYFSSPGCRPLGLVDVVAGLGLGHAVVDDVGLVDPVDGAPFSPAIGRPSPIGSSIAAASTSASSSSGSLARLLTVSPSSTLDQADALGVAADRCGCRSTGVRMTMPPLVVSITSSASVTLAIGDDRARCGRSS